MSWYRKLSSRIVAATLAVLAVATVAFSWHAIRGDRDGLLRQVTSFGESLAGVVASVSAEALDERDYPALERTLAEVIAREPLVSYAWIEDATGKAVAVQSRSGAGSPDRGERHARFGREIVSRDARGQKSLGRVVLHIDARRAEALAGRRIGELALGAAIAFGLLAVALGLIVRHTVARPLAALGEHAEKLRQGRLDETIAVRGGREFRGLAEALDGMRRELRAQGSELRELNQSLRDKNAKLVQALTQAQEATRFKGEFIANISHELRTPLNVIVNVPEGLLGEFRDVVHCRRCRGDYLLEDDEYVDEATVCPECIRAGTLEMDTEVRFLGDPAAAREHIEAVYRAGKHMLAVVSNLLDFNKLESGDVALHVGVIRVGDIFGDVTKIVRPLCAASGVSLRFDVCGPELEVTADRLKIGQILLHLISNAIKFSPEGGRVDVAATADGDECLFCIRDQGIGIPRDKRELIFESFRQADGGHTRQFGGAGLGLSIAKKLVDLHRGAISVDSEEGEGSAFYVRLPIAGPPGARVAATPSGAAGATAAAAGGIVVIDAAGNELTDTQPWRLDELPLEMLELLENAERYEPKEAS